MAPFPRFLFRSGVRVAILASAPMFSALLAIVVLQTSPGEVLAALAHDAFSLRAGTGGALLLAGLAFLLPAWAATRLTAGLHGSIRHLPLTRVEIRRSMTLALIASELPLMVMLAVLGVIAAARFSPHAQLAHAMLLFRWTVVIIAGAMTALPLRRATGTSTLSMSAAALALFTPWWGLLPAALLLYAADAVAGELRKPAARKPWVDAGSLLTLRIAWRALGLRTVRAMLLGSLVLGGGSLYASNNTLTTSRAAGAARFSGTFACVLCIASLAAALAARRQPWPWTRSLPWSAQRRIVEDALFLGIHAILFVIVTALREPMAALCVACALVLLTVRGAEHLRRVPDRKNGMTLFILEGFLVSTAVALVPFCAPFLLAAAWPALLLARRAEATLKVTAWKELSGE